MKFFSYIQKHPVVFFWVSVLYMAVCSPICEVLTASKRLHAFVIFPVNFITWPVAYALLSDGHWKALHFIDRRFVWLLPVVSIALTIVPFILSTGLQENIWA